MVLYVKYLSQNCLSYVNYLGGCESRCVGEENLSAIVCVDCAKDQQKPTNGRENDKIYRRFGHLWFRNVRREFV